MNKTNHPVNITLKGLLNLYNELVTDSRNKGSDTTAEQIRWKKLSQNTLATEVLPEELCRLFTSSRNTTLRVFNGNLWGKENADKLFKHAAVLLLKPNSKSKVPWTYDTSPQRLSIMANWKKLLAPFPILSVEEKIDCFITENIVSTDERNLAQKLCDILYSNKEQRIEETMSCLTLIASTLYYWNETDIDRDEWSRQSLKLYNLILPSGEEQSVWKDYVDNMSSQEEEKAKNLFEKIENMSAEDIMMSMEQNDIDRMCKKMQRDIIANSLAPDWARGKAAYLIYKFSSSGIITLPKGESAEQYLQASCDRGYADGKAEWAQKQSFSLKYTCRRSQDEFGVCVFNIENQQTSILRETAPEGWIIHSLTSPQEWTAEHLTSVTNEGQEAILLPEQRQYYFLLDDDTERNLGHLLTILQAVKNMNHRGITQPDAWNLEIFLRGQEELLSGLVDTALSHMEGCVVPIHILDEEKSAAQHLLYHHPLFYPVRSLEFKKTKDMLSIEQEVNLNFIILGDTSCTEWLARQAFWLMTMREKQIRAKIILLGENSDAMLNRIYGKCPGIYDEQENLKKTAFPSMESRNVNLESAGLFSELERIYQEENGYYYFAIDSSSDQENLSLAIRLREWLVRRAVHSTVFQKKKEMGEIPVIACRFRNADISLLSRTMVVWEENYGNSWFNNYNLIPFGTMESLYSWDQIQGGFLEEVAKCIHLQYCGISENASDQEVKKGLKSYYGRQYNRNSSFAVAMALPYRLFQCPRYHGRRCLPQLWDISDPLTFENPELLRRLAEQFEQSVLCNPDEIQQLAILEHERWVKYMLATGWSSSSSKETVAYIKAANPRQQLYIAKMHPCICDYDKLEELEKTLADKTNLKKNFRETDSKNIKMTGHFLVRSWLTKKER